jgi:hypothetical protein
VLFLADDLPDDVLDLVRKTEGDLYQLRLSGPMQATLTDAFGGFTEPLHEGGGPHDGFAQGLGGRQRSGRGGQ